MKDLVLDASGAVFALSVLAPDASALRARLRESTWHAPHLIEAEVGQALRNRKRGKEITAEQALVALRTLPHLITEHYPHSGPLGEQAWQLCGAISFYDALYVALAESLDVPLITADRRLSHAPGLPCTVEIVG